MTSSNFRPPSYPVVQFLVRHGATLAVLFAAVVLAGVAGWGLFAARMWLVPVGVVAAIVVWGLLLSYVEVLRIIADMLLPKY